MKVFVASDHAGFALKAALLSYLQEQGHDVRDIGAFELDPADDYPDFITPCAEQVASEQGSFGIVIGGSGQGEAMAANRMHGVRAAVYYGEAHEVGALPEAGSMPDAYGMVRLTRQHNDANVLSFGARFVTPEHAKEAVRVFLETPFSEDPRHVRRIKEY